MSEVIDQIVPLSSVDHENNPLRKNGSGLTTHNYRGGIFISCAIQSEVADFENLLNLVHELGHSILNIYLTCDEVIAGKDKEKLIFSVVRKTHRPALLSFHALMASAFMYNFCCEYRYKLESIVDPEYFLRRMSGLRVDIVTGLNNCLPLNFTDLGRQLYCDISSLV